VDDCRRVLPLHTVTDGRKWPYLPGARLGRPRLPGRAVVGRIFELLTRRPRGTHGESDRVRCIQLRERTSHRRRGREGGSKEGKCRESECQEHVGRDREHAKSSSALKATAEYVIHKEVDREILSGYMPHRSSVLPTADYEGLKHSEQSKTPVVLDRRDVDGVRWLRQSRHRQGTRVTVNDLRQLSP
jgi:hypothetical protein